MGELSADQEAKQIQYRDARTSGNYDGIWQSVGKCVFCDLRDRYIVFEENGMALTVSLFAYTDGHLMIIPRRHVRSAKELSNSEWDTVRKFTYMAKRLLKKVHGVNGQQVVLRDGGIIAQSTVSDHLHIHVIPFDDPSLSTWNYRELKLTPYQSASKYRRAGKLLVETNEKFTHKYLQPNSIPLACDLLITNHKGQLLFQERPLTHKLVDNWLTPPGGKVDRFDVPFEQELCREAQEEVNLTLDPAKLTLLLSRPTQLVYRQRSEALGLDYHQPTSMILNTYLHPSLPANAKPQPGDGCEAIVWLQPKAVAGHARISPEIQQAVAAAIQRGLLKP